MAKNKNSKRGNLKKKGKSQQKSVKLKAKGFSNARFQSVGTTPTIDNPFELRMNKSKHDNLGRRGRNEQGVPGISRSRAVEKRKATLLQEYKVRNKTNSLLDNRIGEKRKEMPEEEKIIRRSAAEKARQFKQKSIFNLQDTDDYLTHRGQALIDIDRYEDPRDASDSEDERLDADFVSDANFGGFMKIKPKSDQETQDSDFNEDGTKSHKQIIQELIIESKRKRFEKSKEADENYELVCKLDDDFKNPDIRNLLMMGGKDKRLTQASEPPQKGEYDHLVKELQFETKTGRATDRLKTDNELALEEREKLEQLEKDRLRRMQMSDVDQAGSSKHRSADDLDDGFAIETSEENDNNIGNDEEGSSEDEDGSKNEDSGDASDSYSDMESEDEEKAKESETTKDSNSTKDGPELTSMPDPNAFLDIPFVIAIPIKYKDFEVMLKKFKAHYKLRGQSSAALDIILTRMITYNKASDRSRLPKIFNFIMRYVADMAEKSKRFSSALLSVYRISLPHLHTLLLLNPNECFKEVESGEIFDDFYPLKELPIHKILYFNTCAQLFSVTDFHHKALSSMKVKLLEALSNTKASDIKIVAKLLYIAKIVLKMSKESKRYSPEVINLLSSILQCFTGDEKGWTGFAIPSIRPAKQFLFISTKEASDMTKVGDIFSLMTDNTEETAAHKDISTKLGILHCTLLYTNKCVSVYERLPSSIEIFRHIKKTLTELKEINWPPIISSKISETLNAICNLKQKKEVLVVQVSNRPKPLKLYEPLVEEGFDGIRKKKAPKGKQETARLAHKVKEEMKNAVREIRKDTAFLAKQQLKEQIEKDTERKRKVKEILGSLANQEGEYQKSQKLKKKKK